MAIDKAWNIPESGFILIWIYGLRWHCLAQPYTGPGQCKAVKITDKLRHLVTMSHSESYYVAVLPNP